MEDKFESFPNAEKWECGGCNDGQGEDDLVHSSSDVMSRWTKEGVHLILL